MEILFLYRGMGGGKGEFSVLGMKMKSYNIINLDFLYVIILNVNLRIMSI